MVVRYDYLVSGTLKDGQVGDLGLVGLEAVVCSHLVKCSGNSQRTIFDSDLLRRLSKRSNSTAVVEFCSGETIDEVGKKWKMMRGVNWGGKSSQD